MSRLTTIIIPRLHARVPVAFGNSQLFRFQNPALVVLRIAGFEQLPWFVLMPLGEGFEPRGWKAAAPSALC